MRPRSSRPERKEAVGQGGTDSRERDDSVQHADADSDLAYVRDLGDTGGDHRDERAGKKAVDGGEHHERGKGAREHPEYEAREARKKCAGGEEVEPPERIGQVRGGDAPEDAAGVHHGEDVEGLLRGDGEVVCVIDDVEKGNEKTYET